MPILDIILILFLLICAITDLIKHKVYNVVTFPAITAGLLLNIFLFGLSGLKTSLLGITAGVLILLPFFLLGGMGAGDVKFMAAVGSIKGWSFMFFGGLYGAIIALVISVILMAFRGTLLSSLKKIVNFFLFLFTFKKAVPIDKESTIILPYCFFLSLGMFIRFFLPN
ncbi:MAG: hypothetical protein A2252_01840 [Elusimicrobia bacterium RIFOXYA2_FULL_39_19]|nr:MAG: hypothetical protein A2252_01840 [Elusimicrobia bacterium RIFOXYA2_FULL_39_19]